MDSLTTNQITTMDNNDNTEFYRGYAAAEFTREMELNFRIYHALRLGALLLATALVGAAVIWGLSQLPAALAQGQDAMPDDALWQSYHDEAIYELERELKQKGDDE